MTHWEKVQSQKPLEDAIMAAYPTGFPPGLLDIITDYACPHLTFNKDSMPIRNSDQHTHILTDIEKLRVQAKTFEMSDSERSIFMSALSHLKNEILNKGEKTFSLIVKEMEETFPTLNLQPALISRQQLTLFGTTQIDATSDASERLKTILKNLLHLDAHTYNIDEEKIRQHFGRRT